MNTKAKLLDKPKGEIKCITDFFGYEGRPLNEFRKELKALSIADKRELAQGSAKALGYTQDQLTFPLK